MKMSSLGLRFLKRWEGLVLRLYDDGGVAGVGHCTIGHGHLVHLGPCDGRASEVPFVAGITAARAHQLLVADVGEAERAVTGAVLVPLTKPRFDALVSFAYNVGSQGFRESSVLRAVNAGEDPCAALAGYVFSAGDGRRVPVPGLVVRRQGECEMYNEEVDVTTYELVWSTVPWYGVWLVTSVHGKRMMKRHLEYAQTVEHLAVHLGPPKAIAEAEFRRLPQPMVVTL